MFLQGVTPTGGYLKRVDVKKRATKGMKNPSAMRHTTNVFRDPDVFAILTPRIWQIEIVLGEGKLAQAVVGV